MDKSGVEGFGAYRKASDLFDLVVEDMRVVRRDSMCMRLVSQQIASADSICANIEEGWGRLGRAEYVRFLDFARGSARETRGRYKRMKHWLDQERVADRVSRCDEIIGILTKTINTLRNTMKTKNTVREEREEYGARGEGRGSRGEDSPPPNLPPDPRPPTLDPRPPTLAPSSDPCPADLRRRAFFNERAEQWLDMWYKNEEAGDYSRYDNEFERLFDLTALQPGDAVLDLGCGSGVMVPYILDRIGPEGSLQEVDYAEKMIEVNRRLHDDPRVTFTVAGVDELDVPQAGFDTVFCFSCFPHFHRKAETLGVIHRALKPGGKVVIAHFDSSQDINDHHRKHECVMHDHLPGETEMRNLLCEAGFTVEAFIDESGFYYVGACKEPKA